MGASRERSTDPRGPGSRTGSRTGLASRDTSRDRGVRAGSRQRTPMEQSFSDIKPESGIEGLDLGNGGNHGRANGQTGNGTGTEPEHWTSNFRPKIKSGSEGSNRRFHT